MAAAFERMKREKGKNNDLKPQTLLKTSLSDFSLTFCSSMRLCKKSAAYLFSSATKTVKPFFWISPHLRFSTGYRSCPYHGSSTQISIHSIAFSKKKVRDRNRIRSIVRYVIFAYEIKIQDQTFRMKRLKPIDCSIMSVSHISKFSIFFVLVCTLLLQSRFFSFFAHPLPYMKLQYFSILSRPYWYFKMLSCCNELVLSSVRNTSFCHKKWTASNRNDNNKNTTHSKNTLF